MPLYDAVLKIERNPMSFQQRKRPSQKMSAADPRVITITAEAPALPVFGVRPLPSGVARTRKQLAGGIIQAAGYTSSRRPLLRAGVLFGKAEHGVPAHCAMWPVTSPPDVRGPLSLVLTPGVAKGTR
jgi:hypothetical protein